VKKIARMTICIAFLVLFTAPVAFGQALHDQWFRLKIGISGIMVDGNDVVTPLTCGCENYMHLVWDTDHYIYRLFDHAGAEILAPWNTTFTTIGVDENLAVKVETRFARDSNHIDTYNTSYIQIKKDSHGVFKKATFTGMGCEVHDGLINGQQFYGGCTIKGKTIDSSKLPFTPPL